MSKGFPDPGPTGPRSASSLLAIHSAPCQVCAASHQWEPGRKRGCVKRIRCFIEIIHSHLFSQYLCASYCSAALPRTWSPLPALAAAHGAGEAASRGGQLPSAGRWYFASVSGTIGRLQDPAEFRTCWVTFSPWSTDVLPESHTVIGTAWPERSRQFSPWSASRNAGKKLLFISYLELPQHGLGLQKLEIPGKLTLYICLRWRPAWTTAGFSPWPVWSTLLLAEQLSLTVICGVSSWFHFMICMAAFPSSEIFTLVSLAVEVIHQLELLVNCSHCFALGCCVCLLDEPQPCESPQMDRDRKTTSVLSAANWG